MELATRMTRFGREIFTLLEEKRKALAADGRTIYNMSIGTPDFEPPEFVQQALAKAAYEPDAWKYSLSDLPELLDAVCGYYNRRFSVAVTPSMVTSIGGTQSGLLEAILALCNPHDTILIPDPCYPGYGPGVYVADADPWYYPLTKDNNFLPDLTAIPEEVAKKAKCIVVNLPSNPLGKSGPDGFFEELVAWAKRYEVVVLHDLAYSDVIYDGRRAKSFLETTGAAEVGAELFSLSKSFNVTGARIGFLVGNQELVDAVKTFREHIDFGMFVPLQRVAIAALTAPLTDAEERCAVYENRRDVLCEGLAAAGWEIPAPEGSMFVWAPLPAGYDNSMDFCMALLEKAGVLCTPGSSFGREGEGYVRFALVMPEEQIKKAVSAIAASGMISG